MFMVRKPFLDIDDATNITSLYLAILSGQGKSGKKVP